MFQLSTSRRRSLAISLLVLLVTCTNVIAVPLSSYHQNIKRAIDTLEQLNKIDDDAAVHDLDHQVAESSKTVRLILPEHQTVEFEGDSYNVDNSWLHKSLDDLDQSTNRSTRLHKSSKLCARSKHELQNGRILAVRRRVKSRQKAGLRTYSSVRNTPMASVVRMHSLVYSKILLTGWSSGFPNAVSDQAGST